MDCPTGALEMVSYENNIDKQSKYCNYSINNISNKTMSPNDRFTIKGSQFMNH